MRKIGILTINGYFNYGNRLQNFALQNALEKKGYKVETIINETDFKKLKYKESNNNRFIYNFKRVVSKDIFEKVYGEFAQKIYGSQINEERSKLFMDFTKKYIKESSFSISEDSIPDSLSSDYDFFITGSDQVWNPNFRFGSSIDFLKFAPSSKRIAYAASFGISEVPKKYEERYKSWISEIKGLSVREEDGAKIIKKLTDKEAEVLIDPTLLLTKNEWLRVSSGHINKPRKKYILTYFLGGLNKKSRSLIDKFALDNDYEVVNLAQLKEKKYHVTGPSEFLDYINSAEMFFTDSFHGAVFSILFETPFYVFDRKGSLPSMNSRIDTLLSKFNLESRKRSQDSLKSFTTNVDFSSIDQILDRERIKADTFLNNHLH